MILIKSDHSNHVDIPGVEAPVSRPVDIDASLTGFSNLRTLRIYRFAQHSVIEGHAEEDEVFVVLLSGSVELTITGDNPEEVLGPINLSVPNGSESAACAAYLPPGSAYKLIPQDHADVAYVRATPSPAGRAPKIFLSSVRKQARGVNILWEETTHAERLRARLLQCNAQEGEINFAPVYKLETNSEGLIHVQNVFPSETIAAQAPGDSNLIQLHSWDTIAAAPGEQIPLRASNGSSWLVLVVIAVGESEDT